MLKTGLIQPETIPGQFPRNLRTIVELYRTCLDHGADIVLCPPLALSGRHTGELALRSGFRTQHRAALAYLARETADVPLLLGAADSGPIRFYLLRQGRLHPCQAVIPEWRHDTDPAPVCGLCRTPDAAGFSVIRWAERDGMRTVEPCLLWRTPVAAWHEGATEREEEEARRLALETGLPVATTRLAGGEGPFLLPGASSVWSGAGELLGRLKLFERDTAVIDPGNAPEQAQQLPPLEQQLRHALRKGLADFLLKTGHHSACLNLLECPSAALLARLLKEELPSLPVTGFLPPPSGTAETDSVRAGEMAAALNMRLIALPPFPESPEAERKLPDAQDTTMWRIRQWADREGTLLLSALNGTDLVLKENAVRAAVAADFMPLGDLYESELTQLFPGLMAPAPGAENRDRLLIRMHREHVSATHLASLLPDREQEIRMMQRKARHSEWMRRKLPPRLFLRSAPGMPETPLVHQLLD